MKRAIVVGKNSTVRALTDRGDISMDVYLENIKKYKILPIDEEVEISFKMKEIKEKLNQLKFADKNEKLLLQTEYDNLRNKLVNANLTFAVSVAKQYNFTSKLTLSDLIQSANEGLLTAAELFDGTRGYKFISFAVWWIRAKLTEATAMGSTIRIPTSVAQEMSKIRKFTESYSKQFEHEPSNETIGEFLELSPKKVQMYRTSMSKIIRSSSPVPGTDNDVTYEDNISESSSQMDVLKNVTISDTSIYIQQALKPLSERARYILTKSLGLGCEEEDDTAIAKSLGLGNERVAQIRRESLKRLAGSKSIREMLSV